MIGAEAQEVRFPGARGDQAAHERELREARHLFAEMGATGRAEWVARALEQ